MKERIQKVLANAGVASRRAIEEMIEQGRVAVNGKVMTTPPILVDPQKDKVTVDDEIVRLGSKGGPRLYFLMNKPRGVVTTNSAQGAQRLAIDLLPPGLPGRVYPVGRLDADAKGLLLLTNDGDLTNKLTHPRYCVQKTYRATVDGFVANGVVEQLEKGIWLSDKVTRKGFKTAKSKVTILHRDKQKSVLDIVVREGGERQLQRLLIKFGHKLRDLIRMKMGPLDIKGLGPGEVRELTPREVRQLSEFGEEAANRPKKSATTSKAPTKSKKPAKAEAEDDNSGDFEDLAAEVEREKRGSEEMESD